MRRSRRRGLARERFLMVASAVLVLGSLTATGLWLGRDKSNQDEGYVVDLSAIENNAAAGLGGENPVNPSENVTQGIVPSDDLDYDPYFQETNSQKVENPDQSGSVSMSEGASPTASPEVALKEKNKEEKGKEEGKTQEAPKEGTKKEEVKGEKREWKNGRRDKEKREVLGQSVSPISSIH